MRTLAPGRSTVNMIETRKREHSRKPDEQYDLIESCSPGPYLEMFARYARPGWSVWGNESDEEITPQGQAQRGYAGGNIDPLPDLELNEQMSDWLSDRVARILADEYAKGASVQQISTRSGYSTTWVRSLLTRAGVELRE